MEKTRIFDDCDDENKDSLSVLQINNAYAKNYNNWRQSEEHNKLKAKYGDIQLKADGNDLEESSSSSSSSEDDDDAQELTEQLEKDFFKTLSSLKGKDPKIYDSQTVFFAKNTTTKNLSTIKKPSVLTINDYQRQLMLSKNGVLSDDDIDNDAVANSSTAVQEQAQLKWSFKKVLEKVNSDDEEDILIERKLTKTEEEQADSDYKQWLKGQTEEIRNGEDQNALEPLKNYWNDPNLDANEQFLRDYLLNKRFLEEDKGDYIPTYDEIIGENLSDDEQTVDKQEQFEHTYNLRNEASADGNIREEFIKRYPRTMTNSVRRPDERRKLKRSKIKERKEHEKQQKRDELKQLQRLKKAEIIEKMEKLKALTGNTDLGFKYEDLEGDFNSETYDERMRTIFNEEYYENARPDEENPGIDDLMEFLEEKGGNNEPEALEAHCEDDDFIMDCDYMPPSQSSSTTATISKPEAKKNRRWKRKSLANKELATLKAQFDAENDGDFSKYIDEYYKYDCEDIIGDNIRCRFQYRPVVANDYGLSVEEILMAPDRELNKWCSIKKTVKYRPEHVEHNELKIYAEKARNCRLKQRILPSLFQTEDEKKGTNENNIESVAENSKNNKIQILKSKKRKRNEENSIEDTDKNESASISKSEEKGDFKVKNSIKCSSNNHKSEKHSDEIEVSDSKQQIIDFPKKRKKDEDKSNKKDFKWEDSSIQTNVKAEESLMENSGNLEKSKHKDKLKSKRTTSVETTNSSNSQKAQNKKIERKQKLLKNQEDNSVKTTITDARLSAYGINPKKYRNKLKYGNINNQKKSSKKHNCNM